MKQNNVMSVFDGIEMQKYFLYMTKQAEEAVYSAFVEQTQSEVQLQEFLYLIKEEPLLKQLIKDTILASIANIDWQESISMSLLKDA